MSFYTYGHFTVSSLSVQCGGGGGEEPPLKLPRTVVSDLLFSSCLVMKDALSRTGTFIGRKKGSKQSSDSNCQISGFFVLSEK